MLLSELAVIVAKQSVIIENQGKDLADTKAKVTEMHDLLMQGRGARFALLSVASLLIALSGAGAGILAWVRFFKGA